VSVRSSLVEAAYEIQSLCEREGWGFCFIGGLAVLRWGEPRLTRDVDLTILADYGEEDGVVDGLLHHFTGRLEDAGEFARRYRVVLLFADNGIPIDVALGAVPFERRTVARSSHYRLAGRLLQICGAEDLIIHKVFAGRDHDWVDVRGVLARQSELDVALVLEEVEPLLAAKQALEDLDRLRQMLA
jgi:hypothetical protein